MMYDYKLWAGSTEAALLFGRLQLPVNMAGGHEDVSGPLNPTLCYSWKVGSASKLGEDFR